MLKKQVKRLKKAWHNCLHLDTLITRTVSEAVDNATRQQHYNSVRQCYELLFLQSKESGITKEKNGDNELIVSLTSYGHRIHNVYLTIESIMQQTIKPNKIILWLDQAEFKPDMLPASLKKQQERGLKIKYSEDIKSHMKLIPSLAKYPEDTIITVDDDCIYPPNLIDILYTQHKQHPNEVICTHAHIINFDDTGTPKPYVEWNDPPKDKSRASFSYLPLGFAGVLYPPHCLHSDVFDKNVFLALAPMADDIWFKIMSLRNRTLCRTAPINTDIFDWITPINSMHDSKLFSTNIFFNDIQLKKLMSYYGITQYDFDVYEKTAERIIPELYEESIEQWCLLLKHKYAYELAKSHINEGMRVLEIGCGDGYGANILADIKAEITAVDVDVPSINYAKRKYKRDNLTFETYDGCNIPFEEHSFDIILSFQVIEHVENLDIYFNNINRMLKPNGLVLITTPNRTYRLTIGQKPWNPFHVTEYNEESIKKIAQQYLPQYKIYSIAAEQEIMDIEKERCRPMRGDYNDKEFHYIFKRSNFVNFYSTKDFHLSTDNIDNGLDILLTNAEFCACSA